MPEQTTTVKGEVGKINLWKNKPGYFLLLMGDQNEYYNFGKCPFTVSEQVELEVKEGTGTFSDKYQIVRKAQSLPRKAVVQEKAKTAGEIMAEGIESSDKVYFDRQNLIVRQTCLKAGAEVVGHIVTRINVLPGKAIASSVLELAEMFYNWVVEAEEMLPEPPEEP